MAVIQFDEVVGRARAAKALPLLLREKLINKRLRSRRQELRQIRNKLLDNANSRAKRIEYKKRKKRVQQEIFRLDSDLRRVAKQWSNGVLNGWKAPQGTSEAATGARPDFLIIGARKCGTTFLYDLLTQHTYVEPAAKKELHYFDILFEDEGLEWYRRCFPAPRWKDGRRIITGEASPYLDDSDCTHVVPERVARVLPRVKLIALLRNPVDRAYSDYQQARRKGREPLTFEEAIEVEKKSLTRVHRRYLSRSTYVGRWHM